MNEREAIRVAVLAQPRRLEQLRALLEGDLRLRIVADPPADVWIVDQPTAGRDRGDAGMIALVDSDQADVVLHDPAAGELRLACWLLGENVRLRRRLRIADQQRNLLVRQAQTDPLTGAANRRAWDEELAARLAAATHAGRTLCLAIADLDRFKEVNDTRGHAAGDAVLRAAAGALAAAVRQTDFVARLGGDEFGLLLWDLGARAAPQVLERIRAAVPRHLAAAGLPAATASIGFALAANNNPAAAALFAQADMALGRAKRQGGDRVAG